MSVRCGRGEFVGVRGERVLVEEEEEEEGDT